MAFRRRRVIDSNRQTTEYRIDALSNLPLEPLEYCRRWVEMSSDERGYRKACITALAEATALSSRTIGNWGQNFERRPNYVLHILRMADMLNQIRKIILPADYPQE
ncbi:MULTISPECIES: hypothetical protein [Cyanophyceae]|uniref:hypothetical protein n=1 Tax=Cyanophyceae TaxID=3028117 RepID=UPI00168259D5|nr:hypothetical protein [Trichocoleus sp. FACHB-40]MBD2003852.1 hypothetical protein [Trichocoleus sp. FACHB-40]